MFPGRLEFFWIDSIQAQCKQIPPAQAESETKDDVGLAATTDPGESVEHHPTADLHIKWITDRIPVNA